MAEYEAWQAKRTEETYELKKLLDEARKLTHAGRDAQALVLINQVLERKPSYDEAVELKRLIQSGVGAAHGTLISGGPARETGGPVPADVPNLFLKILQTPYSYLSFTHISLLTEVLTVINLAAIFNNTVHLFELSNELNENTITV